MTRTGRAVVILGIAALAAILPATPALAKGKLLRGFDDEFYRYEDPNIRATWLDRTVDTGARVIRVPVFWRNIAPTEPTDPTDPSDPAYRFEVLDDVVSDATAHGFAVMLQPVLAPDWAVGDGAPAGVRVGTWKPDPAAYGSFAEALGRRYSGQFSGPAGPLPEVKYYEAWNEGNLSQYLTPQWEGNQPVSAIHYRKLLNAFYAGVNRVNPDAQVAAGATAPYGDPGHPQLGRMRPLQFLRELMCLKRRGTAKCPTPARFDILSHHPLTLGGGPYKSAIHRDDAATADFGKLRDLLRRAERERTVLPRGGNRELWATEVWWLSDPPGGPSTFPLDVQARFVEVSLYELWKDGADAVIYYQLIDGPSTTGADATAGLYFEDERPKPALQAFRFPFVTEAVGNGRVKAWTIPPASGQLTIETQGGGGWRAVKSLRVQEGIPKQTTVRTGKKDTRAVIAGEASLTWQRNP